MRKPGQFGARPTVSVWCAIAVGVAAMLALPTSAPAVHASEPAASGVTDPVVGPAPTPQGYADQVAEDDGTGAQSPQPVPGGGPPVIRRDPRGAIRTEAEAPTASPDQSIPAEAAAADAAWTVQTLVTSYETGPPSMQVDANGKTHIVYGRGRSGDGLYYSTNASGTWVTQLVWAGVVGGPALTLDDGGFAHIAFIRSDSGTNGTFYATNKTGTWSTARVESREAQTRPAIAVTSGGTVHIITSAYYKPDPATYAYELVHATNASGSWVVSPLTDSPDFSPSVALDGSGEVHVAFYRSGITQYSLGAFYATNRSGTWVVTPVIVVDPAVDSVWNPSLALDAAGKAHIAFSRSTTEAPWHDGINYATNASGTWITSQITTDRYDQNPSLDLTTAGKVHVAFSRGLNGGPILDVTNTSGNWGTSQLTHGVDQGPSLAIDGAGKVHLAHMRQLEGIRYVTNVSGSWTGTQVASTVIGGGASIALDDGGNARIAYTRFGTNAGLYYASRSTGGWVHERVTSDALARDVALAIDGAGKPHIVYTTSYPGPVRYATKVNGSWAVTSLTAGGEREPAVAVDDQDGVHVVYSRQGIGLLYATNKSGTWVTTQISTGTEDRQPSAALDALGKVHVAFWRGPLDTGKGVWYVTNRSGTWKVSAVETDVNSSFPSLDLDADGNAHIAFNNFATGVRYATNLSGNWVATQITSAGSTPALAVGVLDTPQIAYPYAAGSWSGDDPSGMFHAIRTSTGWASDRVTTFREEFRGDLAVDPSGVISLAWSSDAGVKFATRPHFTDIAGSPFKPDIEWVYTEGITSGCSSERYCPDGYVTREQMASFLARALKLSGSAPDAFTDDESSIHEPNINLVAKAGIATGCAPGKYCPTGLVSESRWRASSPEPSSSQAPPPTPSPTTRPASTSPTSTSSPERAWPPAAATTGTAPPRTSPGARWPPSSTGPSGRRGRERGDLPPAPHRA